MAYIKIFENPYDPLYIHSDGSYDRNETGTDVIVHDTNNDKYYTIPSCCANNYMTVWYDGGVTNSDIISNLANTDIDFRNINEGEFVSSVDTGQSYSIYDSYAGTCYIASFGARNSNSITLVSGMFSDIGLTSISLPCNITEIPSYMFSDSSLEWINIPSSVRLIDRSAFADCINLSSVTFSQVSTPQITTIDENAFAGCYGLETITIPNSVTTIGTGAFWGCDVLTSCTLSNSLTSIEENLFRNCSSLETISIPNSVDSIGDNAFNGCTSLESVTIPDSVTTMGNAIFSGCTYLSAATIGDGIVSMSSPSTFEDCTSLESVDFGSNITSLGGSGLLSGCTALTDIYLRYTGGVVNTSQYLIDRNIASGVTLHVPSSLENNYKNSMVWTQLAGFDANNIVGDL